MRNNQGLAAERGVNAVPSRGLPEDPQLDTARRVAPNLRFTLVAAVVERTSAQADSLAGGH
jgi:hypothetical protein